MAIVNSHTGLATIEIASGDDMHPANNLGELRSPATALVNLGLTSTATEINALDGIGVTVTIGIAAGGANESVVTVTVKDAAGSTVAAVHWLELITVSDTAGTTISTTAYSGSLVASTGALLSTHVDKHHFLVATAATGIFVGTLTDTAATADYIAVKRPLGAGVIVSAALAYGA